MTKRTLARILIFSKQLFQNSAIAAFIDKERRRLRRSRITRDPWRWRQPSMTMRPPPRRRHRRDAIVASGQTLSGSRSLDQATPKHGAQAVAPD